VEDPFLELAHCAIDPIMGGLMSASFLVGPHLASLAYANWVKQGAAQSFASASVSNGPCKHFSMSCLLPFVLLNTVRLLYTTES